MSECEERAAVQVAKKVADGIAFFMVCEKHGELLRENGWMVAEFEGDAPCDWPNICVQFEEVEKYGVGKRRKRAKKSRRVEGDPNVFCNDLYPELRLVIPGWVMRAPVEHLDFRGGRLNLASWKETYGLTDAQIEEAEKVLLEKEWVYREYPKPGEVITCRRCGETFETGHDYRVHEHFDHGEILRSVPANSGIGGK